jgi:hypothetical protein
MSLDNETENESVAETIKRVSKEALPIDEKVEVPSGDEKEVPAPKEEKEELPLAAKSEDVPAVETPAEEAPKPEKEITYPQFWKSTAKELYAKASPELRDYILEREQQITQFVNGKTSEVSQLKQETGWVKQVVTPEIESEWRARRTNAQMEIPALIESDRLLRSPDIGMRIQAFATLADSVGITPEMLLNIHNGTPAVDPVIQETRMQLHTIQQQFEAQQQALAEQAQQQQIAQIEGEIMAFGQERNPDGSQARPLFNQVADEMLTMAPYVRAQMPNATLREVLDVAYQRCAAWVSSQTRQTAPQVDPRLAASQKVEAAKKADVSLNGAPRGKVTQIVGDKPIDTIKAIARGDLR